MQAHMDLKGLRLAAGLMQKRMGKLVAEALEEPSIMWRLGSPTRVS